MSNVSPVLDLAAAWAKANFAFLPALQMFIKQATVSSRRNEDCFFVIGPRLTKGRKPWLVSLFAKSFFAFKLTKEQARGIGAVNTNLIHTSRPPMCNLPTLDPMPIEVTRVEIDHCLQLKCNVPVTGKVQYEVKQAIWEPYSPPVAVLEYNVKGIRRVISYCYPHVLPHPSGEITISFGPIVDEQARKDNAWSPTILAFFRFIAAADRSQPRTLIPISNAVGVLLDVVPAS